MSGIKNFLKRIFPPPTRSFMREMKELKRQKDDLWYWTHKWTQQIDQKVTHTDARIAQLLQLIEAQNARLDRLNDLFESANRENLRLFFDAREERTLYRQQLQQALDSNAALETSLSAALEQQLTQVLHNSAALEKQLLDGISTAQNTTAENLLHTQSAILQSLQALASVIPNKPVLWSSSFERNVVRENWGNVFALPDFAEKYLRLTSGMDPKSIQIISRILLRQKQYLNSNSESLNLFTREEQEELRLLQENFDSEILKLSDDLFAYRNYLLPICHFESSVFYYKHGINDLETAATVKGRTIIDVGGYIGDSVLVLSELEPTDIYTFEAVPKNFELLKKTLELNKLDNVVAENVALGAQPDTVVMHTDNCGSGSTSIDRAGIEYTEDITVPVIRLDDYVAEHNLNNIGLIKVDIEGGEPDFLEGAKKTICEQRPILLLSIYHNAHDFFELKPLIESWDLGYTFRIHKPIYGSATGEVLLLAEIETKE